MNKLDDVRDGTSLPIVNGYYASYGSIKGGFYSLSFYVRINLFYIKLPFRSLKQKNCPVKDGHRIVRRELLWPQNCGVLTLCESGKVIMRTGLPCGRYQERIKMYMHDSEVAWTVKI